MILHFPTSQPPSCCHTGIALLDNLYQFWSEQRAEQELPSADALYISDYVEEMPHLLLSYAVGEGFRVEYTGEVVRQLAGADLIGECLGPDASHPVLEEMARGPLLARAHGRPKVTRHISHVGLHLPYANARGQIGLVVSALWEVDPDEGAEVVPLGK